MGISGLTEDLHQSRRTYQDASLAHTPKRLTLRSNPPAKVQVVVKQARLGNSNSGRDLVQAQAEGICLSLMHNSSTQAHAAVLGMHSKIEAVHRCVVRDDSRNASQLQSARTHPSQTLLECPSRTNMTAHYVHCLNGFVPQVAVQVAAHVAADKSTAVHPQHRPCIRTSPASPTSLGRDEA